VTQAVGPEYKHQYCKNKNSNNKKNTARENGSEQRKIGTKWRQRCQPFLLFLVNFGS
jgi:hypothetical protein